MSEERATVWEIVELDHGAIRPASSVLFIAQDGKLSALASVTPDTSPPDPQEQKS